MEGNAKSDQIVDVGSVVEAVSADDGDAPLYSLESLCMRCGENVSFSPFSATFSFSFGFSMNSLSTFSRTFGVVNSGIQFSILLLFYSSFGGRCEVSALFSSSAASMRSTCIQYSITFTPSFPSLVIYRVNVRCLCHAHVFFLLLCVIAFNSL